jgi:hypothetical protein
MNGFNETPIVAKTVAKIFNDINYDKTHTKFRIFPDKTTEIFTKHFISNPKTDTGHKRLLSFVDYIYNTMNYKILANINDKLVERGFKTMGNEQIFLMFKGGNNLVLLQDIFDKIGNMNPNLDTNELPSKVKNNIKISDNDFTLNIITENEQRFNEIYFCVKELLTISLCEICDTFNGFLWNMGAVKGRFGTPNIQFAPSPLDEVRGTDLLIKFFPFTNDGNEQDTGKLKELESLPYDGCNNTNVLIHAIYIISCYKTQGGSEKIGALKQRVELLLTHKLTYFYDNMYQGISAFKEELATAINELANPDKLYYAISGNKINHFQIRQKVDANNIEFNATDNIFICPSNTYKKGEIGITIDSYLPASIGMNSHYLSINGALFNNLSKIGHLVDFDLLRIKCNVRVNQEQTLYKYSQPSGEEFDDKAIFTPADFKIPSEFVDVSVGKFAHQTTVDVRESYYHNPKHFINSHLYEYKNTNPSAFRCFTMYGSEFIVEDLMLTLFKQGTYTPLYDNKYNKRVVRLFYFYCMFIVLRDKGTSNLCGILGNLKREFQVVASALTNSLNAESNVNPTPSFNSTFYDKPFDFAILTNYCLGKPIFKFVAVKPEYELLKPLLNFVLVFKTIFESNYAYIVVFSQQYNDLYNIIDTSNAKEIFVTFLGFVSECTGIVDYCMNIFCNATPHPEDNIYNYITEVATDEGKNVLVKTEGSGETKYTYLLNGNELFSFSVPTQTDFPNDIKKCANKCMSDSGEEICCDDKNRKYAEILQEFNRLENGSTQKEEMRKLLRVFFEGK